MTYIDSSVALAYLFAEARAPARDFFDTQLVSSRLLEYEVWNRIHVAASDSSAIPDTRRLLAGIELMELSPGILIRALEPWPIWIRTLDSLHLATVDFLRRQSEPVELASYDHRMLTAARAVGVSIAAL